MRVTLKKAEEAKIVADGNVCDHWIKLSFLLANLHDGEHQFISPFLIICLFY